MKLLLALLLLYVSQIQGQTQTFSVLYHFGTNPGDPIWQNEIGLLAQGRDGSLYSTSPSGGKNNYGTVYKITPDGNLTVLYNFDGILGRHPRGGLTLGSDGNFYGTTYEGGKYSVGTIFKITPEGALTILYNFTNRNDGSYPISAPVQASDGNFYGVTTYANNQQSGVLYRISPSGAFSPLYLFRGDNGKFATSLIAASDGNLYGTTLKGDASCLYGTVFKATRSGAVSTLHKFDFANGAAPYNLIQGKDGNLYGTASTGGTSGALHPGMVYKLTLTGEYTVLHAFNGTTDGLNPHAGVVEAVDGYLYGTTPGGGTGGRGVIYRISPTGENFQVVYNFLSNRSTGRFCRATPIQHTNGKLYGTTAQGGTYDRGVFYCLDIGRSR